MTHLLRLEHALAMFAFGFVYFYLGYPLWLFAVLFFAPDLAFIAYAAGPKIGAWVYNFTHHGAVAAVLVVAGLYAGVAVLVQIGLIMAAHIAFDRMLGYGLKHESGFKDTHLGRIGKD